MSTLNLLYKSEYAVNDKIVIRIPTVGEILDHEEEYYGAVSMLTAMPIDMMVQLEDVGVDFSKINEWDLFLLLFGSLKRRDTSLIFAGLDLEPFQTAINPQNNNVILVDKGSGVKIDRAIQAARISRIAGYAIQNLGHSDQGR